MKIIEAKIIRYFMFIYTILGRNANLYVREEVLSYLEKVYDAYKNKDFVIYNPHKKRIIKKE